MSFVFWTLFFILIISLFFLNLQLIRSSIKNTGILDRFFNKPVAEKTGRTLAPPPALLPDFSPETLPPSDFGEDPPAARPAAEEPSPVAGADRTETDSPQAGEPQDRPPLPEITPAAPPAERPAAIRDRALYFIEVDKDGAILRTRVSRSVPATDSPLTDAVQLLLRGPTADERNRGLITLIPPGTTLQSAQVRGSTAYLSLSEEFQFNTYGVEGYIGQLRQIIWTVTEFPNIADVQLLIEGRRIDYLGERIAIGIPLGRNSF
ncbi:MAG: GerMN domain-containing protein [Treponema sp.]|nr:GerMN domain-containing protein [Treponema sp.]